MISGWAREIISELSPLEIVAAMLVLINVWLVARRSVWNYAFGAAGVALTGWVVLDAKLYSDVLLQAFFFVLQFYGLAQWNRSRAEAGEVVVERLSSGRRVAWVAGIVIATLVWGAMMHAYTDAALPWWDAGVAMISVAAQILMSWRKIENWWLWILADILSIGLYAAKDLWVFAALYVLLLGLASWGLAKWLRAGQRLAA